MQLSWIKGYWYLEIDADRSEKIKEGGGGGGGRKGGLRGEGNVGYSKVSCLPPPNHKGFLNVSLR